MAFFQSKHLWVKPLSEGVAVLVLDRDQSTFNFLDPAMLDDFERAIDAVVNAEQFRMLVIRSGKTANFCHGPSPSLLASWSADDFRQWGERGLAVCAKLAGMPIPSACVIGGTCFDAGLELALACDYRVVVNTPTTLLGFPELEWGMIPCWGATQRLPHLVGLENSLLMLVGGHKFDVREAWLHGMADHLAEEVGETPPEFLANPAKRDWATFPMSTWRQRWLESNVIGRWFLFRGAERVLRTRVPDEMPAPREMLNAIRSAYDIATIDRQGLDGESLARIVAHPALHNLLRLLEHREKLRMPGLASRDKNPFRQIGVIGGGTAGLALLLHSVVKGHEVVLRAENEMALGAGLTQIVQLLQSEVQRGAMSGGQFQKTLASVRGTYTWTHFDKLHLILDTQPGTLEERQQFYRDMEERISPQTLIVPVLGIHRVEDLRRGMKHPERVIGLTLIEPWNRGSVAEIIVPAGASQTGAQRIRAWAVGMGKCCLKAPDRPGGIVMRVWLPALNEAAILIKEGVALDRIDHAMRRFGMTYGPLEWMDRLGIDHIASIVNNVRSEFSERIDLETGFAQMVEKGWLGRRVGAGFYRRDWRDNYKAHAEAVALWQAKSQGSPAQAVPSLSEADALEWIQNRLVTLMVLEAVRCLDEGLVSDADDLDCAMCLTGWATHRGGPIGYGRSLGINALRARCEDLARTHGARYAPIDALSRSTG